MRINYRYLLPLIVIGLGLIAAGCKGGPANALVGTWSLSSSSPQGAITVTKQFKDDGTETVTINATGQSLVGSGTYLIKGSQVTETYTSIAGTAQGQTINVAKGSNKLPPPHTSTFAVTGNTLSLTRSGSRTLTFTRS